MQSLNVDDHEDHTGKKYSCLSFLSLAVVMYITDVGSKELLKISAVPVAEL